MLVLVTENQLDEWVRSSAQDAQGVIVELVWRLIAASCPKPRERRFPLPDSIGQRGPDGILDTAVGFERFVPERCSFWEVGTGLRARDKATSDYKDLTDAVPERIRRDSTFIFVTPLSGRRDWEHTWKEEAQVTWLEERRNKDEWKDVRIIDGTKLIDWMHQFPASETGHLRVTMMRIGHVLIYVPADPDGLWIHRSAAAVLNARDAEEMRNGFRTALYNSRGGHWVDPTGGVERELAAKYRLQVEAVEGAGYHRLATMLRELAETYEREAERVLSRNPFDDKV